jgi:hypothetical protein
MILERKPVVYNLLLLSVLVLPLGIGLGWLVTVVFPPAWLDREGVKSQSGLAAGFIFWYLVLVLPVIVGGALHQALLKALPPDWSARRGRAVAIATSPVVLVVAALVGRNPDVWTSPQLLMVVAVCLATYALLAKPVQRET